MVYPAELTSATLKIDNAAGLAIFFLIMRRI